MNWLKRFGLPVLTVGLATILSPASQAQLTSGGDGTAVNLTGSTINITGGRQAGSNLFHSFSQFNVNPGQTANFVDPGVQNILGRVTGGNASIINGILQVSGGNANLYLMNPAGIIFGAGASLNVLGSFTATTANGIGLGDKWFSAVGTNNYADLIANPTRFAFTMNQPGAIVNAGSLAVGSGQSVTLLGGTVINTGTITAPRGKITVTAIPGQKLVNLSQEGSLLSLSLPVETNATVNVLPFVPSSLPQLLTGGSLVNATSVAVENGVVRLIGSNIQVENGDVVARKVTSQTATLSASNNLTLIESQLQTTGNLNLLADHTVMVRDSVTTPVHVQAGGNLTIQGIQGIDILSLNHRSSDKPFQAGGDLALISNGVISGDAHFGSGGNFRVQTLNGSPATFLSLNDPVISSNGNVRFAGSYEGASLKVEAIGNIEFTGGITINNSDPGAFDNNAADQALLRNGRALILRAGQTTLDNPNNVPNGGFTNPNEPISPGLISVQGNISSSSVVMTATETITLRNLNGGSVAIQTPGNITIRQISGSTGSTARLISTAGILTLGDSTDPNINSGSGHFVATARAGIRAYGGIGGDRVELSSSAGNIIVDGIGVGVGGLEINAAGLFQARGSSELANVGLRNRLSDNPEINSFLQSKGINLPPDEVVEVRYGFGASLPVIYSIGGTEASSGPAGSLNAPIIIRFEGATRTLLDSSFPIVSTDGSGTVTQGRILIQGGNGPFFLGPTITGRLVPTISDPFVMQDADGNFVAVTAARFSDPGLSRGLSRNEIYTAAFPTADFPDNISGVAGSIYVGFGTNQTIYGSTQSRLFGPVTTTTTTIPTTTTAPRTTTSNTSSVNRLATLRQQFQDEDGQVTQRQINTQASGCVPSSSVASAVSVSDQSNNRAGQNTPFTTSVSSSCTTNTSSANEDTQILKLLDGAVK